MNLNQITTIEQIKKFLVGNECFTLTAEGRTKEDMYNYLRGFLIQIDYRNLKKKDKGFVVEFIQKTASYSHIQIKRLIKLYKDGRLFWIKRENHNTWEKTYTRSDIELLHKVDSIHKLSGVSTSKILQREYEVYGKQEFIRLKKISPAHIYNLRESREYLRLGRVIEKTKPVVSNIGERKKPEPNGSPGYLRVDSVHQGDIKLPNGKYLKGMYHINIVDEVLQLEFVFSVPYINEKYMRIVLEYMYTHCFVIIINFHSDNGSEYINKVVATMLHSLHIGQTKSRSRKTNDNALVESKNGAIVRKQYGHFHIPATDDNANLLNEFNINYLNIYLNFHRPCGFASIKPVNNQGKIKKVYKREDYKTPYDKLKSLNNPEQYLQRNFSFEKLDKIAYSKSDTEFAEIMNKEKQKMFNKMKLKSNEAS